MRLIFGLFVFTAALFFGVAAAIFGTVVEPYTIVPDIEIAESDPHKTGIAPDPRGIHVMYAGTGMSSGSAETNLKFLIYNGSQEPLHYIGYWADHSFPQLRANDHDLPDTYLCSMGSSRFTIPPGRSAEIHVSREEFLTRPSKTARISVGFRLRSDSATQATLHYSAPFPLPKEFRKLIKSH